MSGTTHPHPIHDRADLPTPALIVEDLGSMPYARALAIQRDRQQAVIAARDVVADRPAGFLLLVEHDPPVITISRRKSAGGHLIASRQQLEDAGVEVSETDRGGDITYHGPGQLVAYPILDLNMLGLRMHSYMRFLEQVVIDTLAHWGLSGRRDPDATGVWVPAASIQRGEGDLGDADAKIAAMGVRVSRWVSMHGLALNVAPNLEHFKLIVPCGLHGRAVTSMQQMLGCEACPAMADVKHRLVEVFEQHVNTRLREGQARADR